MTQNHFTAHVVAATFAIQSLAIAGCGGAQRGTAQSRSAAPSPNQTPRSASRGGSSEGALFASAESALLRALERCPGRSVARATPASAAVPSELCDARAADALLDDATRVLDVIARCRGQSDTCRASAPEIASPQPIAPAGACGSERAQEQAAWREAALALTIGVQLDCRILGGSEGTSLCHAPTGPALRQAALGALEIAATPREGAAVDGLTHLIQTATEHGSVGAQGPWVGMAVGPAESTRQARWACESGAAWREGRGLTAVSIPATGFRLSVPQGTRTRPGVAEPREGLPISVGFATRSLADILASLPSTCTTHETGDATSRALDCAGPDLLSPNRELTFVLDAGDVRGLAIVRVRHDASPSVTATWLAVLRTLTRVAGTPPLDAAQLGARGDLTEWPVVRVAADGALHLSDAVVPRRGERAMLITPSPDPGVCADARSRQADRGRVLLEDTSASDGGCHRAVLIEDPRAPFVLTLHVQRQGDRFIVAQHLAPAADEATARAQLPATRDSIVRVLDTAP